MKPTSLVVDGVLVAPLYHGTSSLFVDSIVEHGLGGRDPVSELNVFEALRHVVEACDRHLGASDERTAAWRMTARHMLGQTVTVGGFNFRYGSVYLSPSRSTAAQYASGNKYGSELISSTLYLYEMLEAAEPSVALGAPFEGLPLLDLLDLEPEPVIIEVPRPRLRAMRGERGEDVHDVVERMSDMAALGQPRDLVWQQLNFELLEPVPPGDLVVHRPPFH